MNTSVKILSALLFIICISSTAARDELNNKKTETSDSITNHHNFHEQLSSFTDNIKLSQSQEDKGGTSISPVGPPYPVTASWFMDRFKIERLNETLKQFKAQGGDTVVLRAPPIIQRSEEDLARDINFQWCGSHNSSSGNQPPMCWEEAVSEMAALGHNVTAFLTYQYEEGFSDDIMLCPKYDRKINSSRVYYRIVLPTKPVPTEDPCTFPKGSDVFVLFTSFAGIDPHQLLLQAAQSFKISVFFGLPAAPKDFQADLMPAYFAWVQRVLHEHKFRFSKMQVLQTRDEMKFRRLLPESDEISEHQKYSPGTSFEEGRVAFRDGKKHERGENKEIFKSLGKKSLYDSLKGYYSTDECNLGSSNSVSVLSKIYKQLGTQVQSYGKRFAISPSITLNRSQQNSTVAQHVKGFTTLAQTGVVDVIAVQEGRGAGKGNYHWPHQKNQPVVESDPVLDEIIHYLDPHLKVNVTFAEAFTASNQELFAAFQHARDQLLPSTKFDFWLNVEAFEYLRDDPCLPVDKMASGMEELLNRASKDRMDRALSVAGAKVQKVISFAWDSDFTCTTKKFNSSLHTEIMSDLSRPIISNCSFHSPHNLSVVVLGFNLEGETQGFKVEWTDTRGNQRISNVYGYYFELDYGQQNDLVASLEYVMLWDISNMVRDLAPTGTVNVSTSTAYEPCSFAYDLPYSERVY